MIPPNIGGVGIGSVHFAGHHQYQTLKKIEQNRIHQHSLTVQSPFLKLIYSPKQHQIRYHL
jgi:hypothetical protein